MNQVLYVVSGPAETTSLFISMMADLASPLVGVVTPDSLRRQEPDWDYSPITAVDAQLLTQAQADTTAVRLHKALQRQAKHGITRRGLLLTCSEPDALPSFDKLRRGRLYLHVQLDLLDAARGIDIKVFKEEVKVISGQTRYFPSAMTRLTSYLTSQLPREEPAKVSAPGLDLTP